eukprot:29472-Pelagococcus_subviridis.AAC.12
MQQIWSATGRRKRASAQVRIASPGTGTIQINQVDAQVYLQGGGLTGQADAIRLGCARALCLMDQTYRSELKAQGYLTRNALKKERKKYGLKKARKAPQFSKR